MTPGGRPTRPHMPRTPVARVPAARAVVALARTVAGLFAAAALAAGCSAGQPSQATIATCYAFAVGALDRHVSVTSVPLACRGLNHEEINLAVSRAIRTVAGPHRKVVARRLAHKLAAYLSYLITVVPPRAPPAPAAAPSRPASALPLRLAALGAWIVTVAAGARLLAAWLVHGGLRRRGTRVAGVPRAVIAGHFTLALAGLGIWIGFLAAGTPALAWAAVGVVLAVAGLGMATLAGGLPDVWPAPPGEPASTGLASTGLASTGLTSTHWEAGPGGAKPAGSGTPGERAPSARATAIGVPAGKPLPLIALHGALAAATILLVVLAAVGAG